MTQIAIPGVTAAQTYDEAMAGAYASIGGVLPLEKAFLEGVPHVITRYVFWTPQKGTGMVSVEAIVASQAVLNRLIGRGKLNAERLAVEADEHVIYNDGGTGIRRQLVQFGQLIGALSVGHGKGKTSMPEDGKLGESRYDLPWTQWTSFAQTASQGKDDAGIDVYVPCVETMNGAPLRLRVTTGLRVSEYKNDTGDNATWYLG